MAQYNSPTRSTDSPPETWGTFGKYDKVVPIAATATYICTGSRAGVGAFIMGASSTGGITGSLGGKIPHGDLTAGVVYEIGVSQINVKTGTFYALQTNRHET